MQTPRPHFVRAAYAAVALSLVLPGIAAAQSQAKIDAPAPAFTLRDWDGNERKLSEFKGKTVVLEWTNDGCPFVKKHYESGNMQALQKKWMKDGVAWIVINSSAKGQQGHISPADAKKLFAKQESSPTAYLFDGDGVVGKRYGATATPHMYVIDQQGTLRYMGAIDDKPTADKRDIPKAKNYADAALEALKASKPVPTKATRAYGCNVKYAD